MPPENKFTLPTDLGNKSDSTQTEELETVNLEAQKFPFIHVKNKKWVIAVFVAILVVSSAFTWVSLDTIDVRFFGRTYSIITREPFDAFLDAPDESQINITTAGTARVLVRFPNDSRVGDTVEGVRYADKSLASIQELYQETASESAIPKRQGFRLTLHEPLAGRYALHFSTPEAGSFPYEVELTGRSGVQKRFTGQISLKEGQEVEYILVFRKNMIPRSKLTKPGLFDLLFSR